MKYLWNTYEERRKSAFGIFLDRKASQWHTLKQTLMVREK